MRGKQGEKGQRKERRDKGQKRKKTDKETAEKDKKEKGKLSAPAPAPVNVSYDIVYETWKANKIDTSYAIRNNFSSKMNKSEKRIMDEYEKSASFAVATMEHVTKSTDVAIVKKNTTNKKRKNIKKVVKKSMRHE